MSFATRLKEARSKAGLSQKDLALKLGTSPQNLAQYENGKRNPKKETLVKIANALDMGVTYSQNGEAYFFCFVDPEEPRNSENNLFNDSQLKDASDVSPSSQYNEPITIAAHFEGDNFTPEELKQIEQFAEFIKSKRTPKEETFLNAAHDMGATPEQRRNADDIMQDDSEWDDIPAPKRATAPAKRHEEELLAAHARIDVESTPEGLQHDLDIMNDDSKWNK